MFKKTAIALMLMAGVAQAENEMAFIPNTGGGYIFFTYSDCVYVSTNQRVPDKFYVYSTNKNGGRISDGCYEYRYPFYIINWNSGSRTNVNVSDVTIMGK